MDACSPPGLVEPGDRDEASRAVMSKDVPGVLQETSSRVLLVGRLLQNNRNYVGMDGISSVGV